MRRNGNGKNGHGKGHNSNGVRFYPAYNYRWVDKDPVIDRLRTLVQDEGLSYGKLSAISRVSATTYSNWFDGDTKRPQYATIAATVMSLGHEIDFVKKKTINYDKAYDKARAEIAAIKEKADRAERRAARRAA